MRDDTLVHWGGEVKAMDAGRVAGYLVRFSDESTPDLSAQRDFFSKNTDFDIEDGDRKSVYYSHGLDAALGVKRIGTATVKTDDVGVWVEAQLDLRGEYERHIFALAKKGKLGWSSGAPSHLVTRKAVGDAHEVLTWNISEASLTPTPAEPRNDCIALKSLAPLIGLPPALPTDRTVKALPSGMSYDDLRALLQDELNEDIGDDDDDGYGPGLWIEDIYDDAVVFRDEQDLFRIPYTVTAGNDVTWGTPESVVRTTVYQSATDGDTEAAAAAETLPKSLTVAPPVGVPFDAQLDAALAAVAGVIDRGSAINEMRIKSGRVMSASSRAKLKKIHGGMQAAHALLGEHVSYMSAMLDETQGPVAAKKAVDAEIIRFLECEARGYGVEIRA